MLVKFNDTPRLARTTEHTTGVQLSDRARALGRLVPLWPSEIEDISPAGRQRLLAALRRALRAERQRGLNGHWAYDLARHRNLLEAYRAETSAAMTAHFTGKAQHRRS